MPLAFRIARLAFESGQDIVGSETRRTGRVVVLSSVAVVLVVSGAVRPEAISGLGVQMSSDVATLRAVLVLVLSSSVLMFLLRLVTDLERVARDELYARARQLQVGTEAETRRLEEAAMLDGYLPEPRDDEVERAGSEQALTTRLGLLSKELADLRYLGETGSRFTRYSADRRIVEAEVDRVVGELHALNQRSSGADEGDASLPPRLRLSADYLARIEEINDWQAEFGGSALVRSSRRLRIALDVCLAPAIGFAALTMWAMS